MKIHVEDFLAIIEIGQGDFDYFVEPAGPDYSRIEHVQPVGRPQHQHPFQFFYPVKFGQELTEHPFSHVGTGRAACAQGNQSVYLIKEDNAG